MFMRSIAPLAQSHPKLAACRQHHPLLEDRDVLEAQPIAASIESAPVDVAVVLDDLLLKLLDCL